MDDPLVSFRTYQKKKTGGHFFFFFFFLFLMFANPQGICFILLLSMGGPLKAWLTNLNLAKALVTGISRTAPLLAVVITTSLVTYFQLNQSGLGIPA